MSLVQPAVFPYNFLKARPIKRYFAWNNAVYLDRYAYQQVFKIVIDGNCCASVTAFSIFWDPMTVEYASGKTGALTERLELRKGNHSSFIQNKL
jgi:hypothetical protein